MEPSVSFNLDRGSTALIQAHNRGEFVGREPELSELLGALDETRRGQGRAMFIGGEPGIGKSRLADELASRAQAAGCLVLWGRGWEDAGAPAYWPWVQSLRTLLRAIPRQDLFRHLGSGAADVAQMLPELHELLPELVSPAASDGEAARFQLFDSTTTLLRRAAAEQPLLIVLDDLHAADTPSILLLRFIASQLRDMAVLILGTYRDLELTADHPLTLAISEMARERSTRLVMLGGLGSDAVSDYISAATNIQPDGLTVASVWRATNGNPLFVGEAVRLLEAEGRLSDVADLTSLRIAVPTGVRAVIARRIEHLTDDAGTALAMAAVVGPEFSLDLLRRIGELSPNRTYEAVEEAASARLLNHVAGATGRYRFSHDLVRETLYDQIAAPRRAVLHRRIGETLETVRAANPDAHLPELAFHFAAATRLAEFDTTDEDPARTRARALDYARRAADQATGSLAYEEARQLYAMALAALDSDPNPDRRLRAELLLAVGDADARAGDLDRARLSFLEAADLARELDSGTLLARAALGYGGRHQWARAGRDVELVPLLEDALNGLGNDDDRLRVRLLTRLSGALRSDPTKRDECARLSQEAIDLARKADDDASLGYALAGRFWATWWPENPEERAQLATEIMSVAESVGDGERLSEAHLMLFLTVFEQGRMDEARHEIDRLGEVVRRTRQPAHVWLEPVNRAELALFGGDYVLAESLIADEFKSSYRVTPGKDDLSAAHMHRFHIRREQGRLAEIESDVRHAVREFPWYPFHKAALCILLAELGRLDEARVVFGEIAANDFSGIYHDNEWLLGMSLASQACALLGDERAAATLYEKLAPYAGRHAVGNAEGSVGWVDTYLGLLAATVGRYDDAERHLDAAITSLSEQGGRPWVAHAQHDLAQLLRRRGAVGDADRAAQLDADALGTATELGMALAREIASPDRLDVPPATAETMHVDRAGLVREGDYWAIEFGADSFRVRDSKGMHHLARLLRSPGREMHALDLVHVDAPVAAMTGAGAAVANGELSVADASDTGPLLDAEAKQAYRARLESIGEDLAEAERWNDPERVALLEEEREALIHELAAAVGLGNRDRTAATSSAERARVSVTRAIRSAMERIAEYSPALGAHLEATIRTGTFCAYVPDPRAPMEWTA